VDRVGIEPTASRSQMLSPACKAGVRTAELPAHRRGPAEVRSYVFIAVLARLSIARLHSGMVRHTSHILEPLLTYTPYLALLARTWFGATLMIHGKPKLNRERRAQSIANFKAKGVPTVAVVLGVILEFFGGLFLVVGLIVPVVATFEAIYFASIIATKRAKDQAKYVAFGKPNYELEAFFVLISIVLVLLGAGALSLDGGLGL
jgi:uncharacterized membrane protein YphA (DoxX/SURF4 family)